MYCRPQGCCRVRVLFGALSLLRCQAVEVGGSRVKFGRPVGNASLSLGLIRCQPAAEPGLPVGFLAGLPG